jgi:hypothetical protein
VLRMLEATGTKTERMPPPKNYARKLISLPPELARAVKDFRFRRRLENDTEAYRLLIQKGLEAFESEEQAAKPRRRP